MKLRRALIATSWVLLLGGCGGLDELGVRSIEFHLTPTPITIATPPPGLDALTIARFGSAHGSVTVDVSEDMGMVSLEGLPVPPTGFTYQAIVRRADGERHALPGTETTATVGHTHGALSSRLGDELSDTGEELTNVPLGELEAGTVLGAWELMFSEADLDGAPLGSVRGMMIQIVPDGQPGIMIMAGQVEADSTSEGSEGGGHDHGA